jgi:hypothetical protein
VALAIGGGLTEPVTEVAAAEALGAEEGAAEGVEAVGEAGALAEAP